MEPTATPRALCRGIFLPPFNEFANPQRLVSLAVTAEARGWDGVFLWDHVLRDPSEAPLVADPWIALAAMACATETLRLGTMVTPLVRRRPQVLARQVVTLDHLSDGRVTLGLGLGVDSTGELTRFGEPVTDPIDRGDLLDEGAAVLAKLLSGEEVNHSGRYFKAEGVRLLPRSIQRPRIPIWLGVRGPSAGGRAARRAGAYEGAFLIDASMDELHTLVKTITRVRGSLTGFDLAVLESPGGGGSPGVSPGGGGSPEVSAPHHHGPEPAAAISLDAALAAGATWAMLSIRPETPADEVEALVEAGPRSL